MNCAKIQKRISAYIDGELHPRQMNLVRNHLNFCQICAAEYKKFEQIESLLDDGLDLHADSFLLTRIKANLHTHSPRRLRPAWSLLQKALAPVCVVAGLVLGILLGVRLNTILTPDPTAESQPAQYSVIDSNFFEPMPTGSLTATYVSMDNSNK